VNGVDTMAWSYADRVGWSIGIVDFVVRKEEIIDYTVIIDDELVMLEGFWGLASEMQTRICEFRWRRICFVLRWNWEC
jgi:hypothetical protein